MNPVTSLAVFALKTVNTIDWLSVGIYLNFACDF